MGKPGKINGCVNFASGLVCLDGSTGKQGMKGIIGLFVRILGTRVDFIILIFSNKEN